MKPGEAVIENGLIDRVLPPLLVGLAVFAVTRLYDAWQFDKKLAELAAKMVTKEDLKGALSDFRANHIQPLERTQSKFDNALSAIHNLIAETRETVLEIRAELRVKK